MLRGLGSKLASRLMCACSYLHFGQRFRFWVFKLPVNYICLNLGAGSPTSQGVLPGASGLIAGLIAVRAALFGGLHHVFYAYVFPSGGIYR